MKSTIIIVLFLSLASAVHAADEYSGYIRQLAADTPERDSVLAKRALVDADARAFPALLAHFGDRQLIHASLNFRDVMRTPTVGEVCFDILQTQIEGNWPKGFRQFYILTPGNAKQWLDDHKDLSLRQLQLASREQSLRRAYASLSTQPSDFTVKAVAFLREEIAKLKQ